MSTKMKTIQVAGISNDAAFAEAVEQLTCLIEAGDSQRAAELIEETPEHADKLRRLLPAIEALASLDDPNSLPPATGEGLSEGASSGFPPRSAGEGLWEGSGLLGDFRIQREIGRGGMGVVYEATQISLNRRVALKVLPLAAMLDARRLERFRHEAQAAAMLRHPNIVSVFSVGCERGVHYYAMDYVEGPSLAEVVEQMRRDRLHLRPGEGRGEGGLESAIRNPQSEINTVAAAALSTLRTTQPAEFFRAIARLGIQAAEALDYAHQMGVVHRDIKPSNLLIDCTPSPLGGGPGRGCLDTSGLKLWITDFGLAMTQTDAGLTMTGDLLGTLRYMSPEQAAGKRLPLDHRTDVYSLGITLYELLAGRPAFDIGERAELLRAIAEVDPPPLRKLAPAIPADLQTIVHKAVEKDAADRYSTAGDLADDLQRYVEDRTIVARRTPFSGRARKWLRRHSALATCAAAVLLLVVAGLATSTLLIGRQAQRAEENLILALAALEETLAESVVGDLIVEPVDAKRAELQRRGIDFYEKFALKNGLDPKTWPTYRLLVLNQHLDKAYSLEKADPEKAERAFQDAIADATELVKATSGEPRHQARLIHAIDDYGNFLANNGRADVALRQSMRAGDLAASLAIDHPDFTQNAYLHGKILYNRAGQRYRIDTRPGDAIRHYNEAHEFLERAFDAEPKEIRVIYLLASCRYNLGWHLAETGAHDEATDFWQKASRDWRTLTLYKPLHSEYQSRTGATLSNLATQARKRADYKASRSLSDEAIVYQKRALKTEPVFEFAKDFLRQHYRELSQALFELGDYTALAATAEARVADLPDVPFEYCAAAKSLADSMLMLKDDERLSPGEQERQLSSHAKRALALLDAARNRFEYERAQFIVAEAYFVVGDKLSASQFNDESRKAWESARTVFIQLQDKSGFNGEEKVTDYIKATEERMSNRRSADVSIQKRRDSESSPEPEVQPQ
jgi:serine/threonine protein kinase